MKILKLERIAEVAHEAHKIYCHQVGRMGEKGWNEAPEYQRRNAVQGVRQVQANPLIEPAEIHAQWVERKKQQGWKPGDMNAAAKTSNCLVPFEELEPGYQAKPILFLAIVKALLPYEGEPEG